MHSTTTKALLQQIAHCDGHVFLIQPWEDNHCSLEKNVQKLTHTSSKGFYPRDRKLLQFYDRRCPWKEQKKSLLLNSLQVKLFSITYHLHPLNIDLESLRIDLSFGKKRFFTECKLLSNNSEKTRAQKSARDGWLHKAQSLNCRRSHEDPDFLFFSALSSILYLFFKHLKLVGLHKDRCHLQSNDAVKLKWLHPFDLDISSLFSLWITCPCLLKNTPNYFDINTLH